MKVLLLGSGGREHALCWKIRQSRKLTKLFIAPGNGGSADQGEVLDLSVSDFEGIASAIEKHSIDMLVVGPEDPLVNGIYDFLKTEKAFKDLMIIGPSAAGAVLEGSKSYAKDFMNKYGIPTAGSATFTGNELSEAKAFLQTLQAPYVLKADGLAAGKGVLILNDLKEAEKELEEMFSGKFGDASSKVVIEDFLDGIEMSVFALTDGKDYLILPEAKDYKRIGEGDMGLNTGGMGAVSPVPFADKAFMEKVEKQIVAPTISGIQSEGFDYTGFVFFGLMNVNGDPYVIEYNVRMGDPETQAVIPRIKSDLLDLFIKAASGELNQGKLEIEDSTSLTLVLASGGYPGSYEKGGNIRGVRELREGLIFHAGTKLEDDELLTNGGRVLAITSFGRGIAQAREKVYTWVQSIRFDSMYYRKDIGLDLLEED